MPDKAKWTIFTYIAGHNNLEQMGKRSLAQIVGVGSTRDVMHGVLFDGAQGATQWIVGDPGRVLEKCDLPNFDSGDPARLIDSAKRVFERCPAERYGLVLWSHGTGWMPSELQEVAQQVRKDDDVKADEAKRGSSKSSAPALFRTTLATILSQKADQRAICFDDGSQHSIDTVELGDVARRLAALVGGPLDLVGMDACLMASVEVAYQLRNHARILVASEERVPGTSWPYDIIFDDLKRTPDMSGRDLALRILDGYMAYYEAAMPSPLNSDVTKVALDLSKIDALAQATDRLGVALQADMITQAPALWSAQVATKKRETQTRYGVREPSKFGFHLWDVRTLATALSAQTSSLAVKTACDEVVDSLQPGGAVVREAHLGEWFDGLGGVSVYLAMPNQTRITPYYPQVDFAQRTSWDKMLDAYHAVGEEFA
jgi:hypothetical protein